MENGKTIFDNVSGFIKVNEFHLSLINQPLFQRLRKIKQNGFLNYVFTGAEHTRFAHSLGVFKNMQELLGNSDTIGDHIKKQDKDYLLLAALLHDIGHYPLSHTLEGVMTELHGKKHGHHEKNALYYLKNSSLNDILEKKDFDVDLLARIIDGTSGNQLFTQIMHSELDMDRLDYLIRDSTNCGIAYGVFDRHQLMRTLEINDGQLVVSEKGKTSVEHYILSRYYMYSEIYSHHTAYAFKIIGMEIFKKLLEIKKAPALSDIQKSPEEFLWFDDNWFFHSLFTISDDDVGERIWNFRNRLLYRNPLRVAKEAKCLVEVGEQGTDEYKTIEKIRKKKRIRQLILDTGIPEDYLFVSFPQTEISGLKPYYEPNTEEDIDERVEQAIRIKGEGEPYNIASDANSVIRDLATKNLFIARVYAPEKYIERIKDVIKAY